MQRARCSAGLSGVRQLGSHCTGRFSSRFSRRNYTSDSCCKERKRNLSAWLQVKVHLQEGAQPPASQRMSLRMSGPFRKAQPMCTVFHLVSALHPATAFPSPLTVMKTADLGGPWRGRKGDSGGTEKAHKVCAQYDHRRLRDRIGLIPVDWSLLPDWVFNIRDKQSYSVSKTKCSAFQSE